MNKATWLLATKIKEMFNYEGETEFYYLEDLFTDEIDVPAIVQTFRQVYDDTFSFEGTAEQLFYRITVWINENIG